MPPQPISLSVARAANGLAAEDPLYERVKVAVAPSWLKTVWIGNVRAMSLPRHIYVSEEWFDKIADGRAKKLLTHESVHIEQWAQQGRFRFLVRYLSDYVRGRASGLPHGEAYRAIGFEKEASSRIE